LALLAIILATSCANPTGGTSTPPTTPPTGTAISGALKSVELITSPTTVVYFPGDTIDLTGISVRATYETGSKIVDPKDLTVTGFDSSKPGSCYLKFTYLGLTATKQLSVTVGLSLDVSEMAAYPTNITSITALRVRGQFAVHPQDTVTLTGDWKTLNDKFWELKTLILLDQTGPIASYGVSGLRYLETLIAPESTRLDNSALYIQFSTYDKLKTLTMPKCLSVGTMAASERKNLTSLSMPVAITIGNSAFYRCDALASAYLPKVTNLGTQAFEDCSKLTNAELPLITAVPNYAFSGCYKLATLATGDLTAVGYYGLSGTGFSSIDFPNLATIGVGAFANCANLASVNLPKLVLTGQQTFMNCSNLTSVTMPLVTSAESEAFTGCTKLAQVNMPLLTNVGYSSFKNCGFTKLDPSTFITSANLTITGSAFSGNKLLTMVNLPAAISIPETVFSDCTALRVLILPAASSLDFDSLFSCAKLETIYAPNVGYFGSQTWTGLTALKEIVLNQTASPNIFKTGGMTNTQSAKISLYLGPTDYASISNKTWGLLTWKEIKTYADYVLPVL
jgi:hypothetical protein